MIHGEGLVESEEPSQGKVRGEDGVEEAMMTVWVHVGGEGGRVRSLRSNVTDG